MNDLAARDEALIAEPHDEGLVKRALVRELVAGERLNDFEFSQPQRHADPAGFPACQVLKEVLLEGPTRADLAATETRKVGRRHWAQGAC